MASNGTLKYIEQLATWREHPGQMVRDLFGVEPDAWQLEVLEAFPHYPRIAMQACKGPGKAHPKSVKLWTPDGKKEWGALKPGDQIFAGDGSITKVKAVYDRGVLPVFKITFDDGSSTRACGEHLWKVRGRTERRKNTWSVISTQQIIDRGVRAKNGRWAERQFEIPRQGAVQYPHKELPIDPYVLGVWLGDGVRGRPIYATKPTHEIEEEINRRGYGTSSAYGDEIVGIRGIVGYLRSLGVLDSYSYEKSIPVEYMTSGVEQRRDLLMGLMDTDGEIADDGHMGFSSTSKKLAEDIVWLARSLGGVAYIKDAVKKPFYYGKNREKIFGKDCYRVTLSLPFNPFLVPHRRERWKDPTRNPSTIRYMTRKIDSIEPDGFDDCMCIEVEHEEKLYLINDFIVTHNTCLLAWIGWNFLLTRPRPKCAAVSISGANLADNFWTEMAKWQKRSPLLVEKFEWTKTRISFKEDPQETFMTARSWPQSGSAQAQADTLAGLHADYILFIIDESGGMPEAVLVAADAALSSCVEGHIVQAGNPTSLEGALALAAIKQKALWHVVEITGDPDAPNRSPRMSIEWCNQMIKTWGREHPYVMVNVLGKFPPSSFNSLIGPDEVRSAMSRYYREFEIGRVPKIMGVDIARFGDDASCIAKRQGIQMFPFTEQRGLDSLQGATIVAREWDRFGADAVFLDATGGFGSGWLDQLSQFGRSPIGIQFSGVPHDKSKFHNKRTEMMFDFVDWIKAGGGLPDSNELLEELTQTTYTFQKNSDKLIIEPKEMIKARIGRSPDKLDAAMMTFAEPIVLAKPKVRETKMAFRYDPFSDYDKEVTTGSSYSPFEW